MFDAAIEHIESGQVTKYRVTLNGDSIPYARVVDLWHNDAEFRQYFSELLAQSPFSAYRWETPAFSDRLAANPFEFVLLNCPSFATRRTDSKTYADYFTIDDANDGIVTFANLSGDATLIVPSPRASSDIYGHLASFIRGASKPQLDSFWRIIGSTLKSKMGKKQVWLSTAGGGVAWLHVRLDARPKYYGYSPYKKSA